VIQQQRSNLEGCNRLAVGGVHVLYTDVVRDSETLAVASAFVIWSRSLPNLS
jgi:hypothetical protein